MQDDRWIHARENRNDSLQINSIHLPMPPYIQSNQPQSASHAHHPADLLIESVADRAAPVCVGLDPVLERLPASLQPSDDATNESIALAFAEFCNVVCESVSSLVPCVKFQSACFERYGSEGIAALQSSIEFARSLGLVVILDAKRGDIGISATHYANATHNAEFVTVNGYLGMDGIAPFLSLLDNQIGGAFALIRTSNPGSDRIQNQQLENGKTVAEMLAGLVAETGADYVGNSGYSALGAVVGATKTEDIQSLRNLMPQQIFLVPGYGAQGGNIDDILPCFHEGGRGAIITSSRAIIYAFAKVENVSHDWSRAVASAAEQFANDVGTAVGLR